MANFCKKCGSPLSPGIQFCTKCGTRIMAVASAPAPVAMPCPAPAAKSSGGAAQWVIAALVVVAACGAGWYFWQGKSESKETVAPTATAPAAALASGTAPAATNPSPSTGTKPVSPAASASKILQTTADAATMPSDLGLGGICIGYTKDKVYSILGREQKITDPDKTGHLHYQYPDVEVIIANGTVTGIVSSTSKASTKRGIHEGSTLQEVLRAYGEASSKFTYGGLTMYEYPMQSLDRKECLLRFAIKNNRVDYISGRVAD